MHSDLMSTNCITIFPCPLHTDNIAIKLNGELLLQIHQESECMSDSSTFPADCTEAVPFSRENKYQYTPKINCVFE